MIKRRQLDACSALRRHFATTFRDDISHRHFAPTTHDTTLTWLTVRRGFVYTDAAPFGREKPLNWRPLQVRNFSPSTAAFIILSE